MDSSEKTTQESGLGTRPWQALREVVNRGSAEQLQQFLDDLPAGEMARAVSRLDDGDQIKLMIRLRPEMAAELVDGVSEAQAVELLELLPVRDVAAILQELESDERADILSELDEDDLEAILAAMDPDKAANARRLAEYLPETAGGLMITELLCYRDDLTVQDVLDDLRQGAERYSDYDVQYAYVVQRSSVKDDSPTAASSAGDFGRLVGVLRLRDLVLSSAEKRIADVAIRETLAVGTHATLDELAAFFDRYHFFGVPVVDAENRLVGVVRRHDVEEALADRADDDNLKLLGIIAGEELRTMPLSLRAGRRLAWLIPNIMLNVIAISVIAYYEATVAQVVALAILLPLISDMGGNAGVQALAVSIREMNLGLLRPHELMWVTLKESSVGLLNGVVLGLLVAIGSWIWQQNLYLGLVVGVAMLLNTLIATTVGGLMPLVMKRMNIDPALASGPILTTITDMTGFFFVLSLATLVLAQLVGGGP
ncbi:MAG: magnesium transporter [Planctomycetaceae bacterium]|nr:MAG: magnesium transporter [Planctomycetaceae bacterium]